MTPTAEKIAETHIWQLLGDLFELPYTHMDSQVVSIPVQASSNAISKQTLESQFAGAIGLKYEVNGSWLAVPIENGLYHLPDFELLYIVVTANNDRARTILRNPSLANEMASVFRTTSTSSSSFPPSPSISPSSRQINVSNSGFRQNFPLSRKKIRTTFGKTKILENVFKVVFIDKVDLPTTLSKELIIKEGFITVKSINTESEIMSNLTILVSPETTIEDIQILSYSSKILNVPVSGPGFQWTLKTIKANVGQGQIYVMVDCSKNGFSGNSSSSESLPDLLQQDEKENTHVVGSNCKQNASSVGQSMELESIHPTEATGHRATETQAAEQSAGYVDAGTPSVQFRTRRNHSVNTPRTTRTTASAGSETDNTASAGSEIDNKEFEGGSQAASSRLSIMERRNRLSLRRSNRAEEDTDNSSYRAYVGLFPNEVVVVSDPEEDDDEEEKTPVNSSLIELLVELRSQLDTENISKFNICRNDVLGGARRAIKRKSFNPKSKISIKFTDSFGNSEGAVDEGGPTREFLRMLLKKIQKLYIFEGPENSRILTFNCSAMDDNLYRDVGVFISLSIVHGGPSPKFFSPVLYTSLVKGIPKASESLTVEDICDTDLRAEVQKLKDAENVTEVTQIMESMSTLLITAGCFKPFFRMEQKNQLIADLVRFLVLERTSTALQQLASGLETLGVLAVVKKHPIQFQNIFTHDKEEKLSSDIVETIFNKISFSPEGSNKRVAEEKVVGFWRDFLIDLEEEPEGCCLADILVFATGADMVPPLGFDPEPSIAFIHDRSSFPIANTCGMILRLPVVDTYDTFKSSMLFGVLNSWGFGMG